MSPLTFNDDQWDYVKKHLFILSGFYGVVNAMDGIKPYRLEMLSSFKTNYFSSLYDFWKDDFYQYLYQNDHLILNLCSDEYSKTLIPFIKPNQELINVSFYEESQGKRKQKTVYLKMARGSMVRYLAQINAQTVEDVKKFTMLGYQYDEKNSTNNHLIFIRKVSKTWCVKNSKDSYN